MSISPFLWEVRSACSILDFHGNLQSAIFLVSLAPDFDEPLPCNTCSIAAVKSLCQAQNTLRNPALLQYPSKSIVRWQIILGKNAKKAQKDASTLFLKK